MSYISQLITFLNQAQTTDLHTAGYDKEYKGLSVKVSFGQANRAKIPWIAFVAEEQHVSNGIYPVFLYYEKYSLLILAYGISEVEIPKLSWGLHYPVKIENIIDVKRFSYRYGKSYVFRKYFLDPNKENCGLDSKIIETDLDSIIKDYHLVLSGNRIIESNRKCKNVEIKEEEEIGIEGKRRVITSISAERNPSLRKKALKYHGKKCRICGFDFGEAYGEKYGQDFIEIHHIHPLSEGNDYIERLTNYKTDLVPVCSNCHRMLHRKRNKVLSIEKLRSLLSQKYRHK